jgi:hypothetical protein
MSAAHHDPDAVKRSLPDAGPVLSAHVLGPPVEQELAQQFESVLEFADACTYLTHGGVKDRASRLVDVAQALYSETTGDLQRGAGVPSGANKAAAPPA